MTEFDAFTQGYLECALWSSSIEEDFLDARRAAVRTEIAEARRLGRDPQRQLCALDWLDGIAPDCSMESYGFTIDDIDAESLERIREELNDFVAANLADLNAYASERSWTSAGHDLWLTRNGHGAGFWDRGLGELGDRLTEAAKPYGEQTLYVGDDERIYVT